MVFAVNASSLITELERVLRPQGWLPDEQGSLPESVKWVPDRLFKRSDGKRMAVEREQEVNIPRFLVRIKESSQEQLIDIEIIVVSPRNTLLDIGTARIGIQHNISIYAGIPAPKLILDPTFPSTMLPVTSTVFNSIRARFESNKRIPQCLTAELEDLSNMMYSNDLKQFAHDYERNRFDSREEEHQFVHDFLMNRFARRFSANRLFEGLNVMRLLEDVSQVVLGKREHFLHSFQTFLLGSIIIDKNYELFNQWYSCCFETEDLIKIDVPWFFASLFHDVASPFERLESWGPVGELLEPVPRGLSSIYSPRLLGCLFESQKRGKIGPEWEPTTDVELGELFPVLMRHRFDEHGVIGALNLISCAQQLNRRTLATAIWPAALAISVHSSALWTDLISRSLFPVSAEKFPLAFILLLCDNIEEWGREPHLHESTTKKPVASLLRINFNHNVVTFNLWVDEPSIAMIVKNRHEWITQELFRIPDFNVECIFYKTPTASEPLQEE